MGPLISQLILFIIIGTSVYLMGLVFYKSPKKKSDKIFLISIFFLLIWILFGYLITLPEQTEVSVILRTKIAYLGVLGWLVSIYFFLKYFPVEDKKENPLIDSFIVLSGLFLALVTFFTDKLVKGATLYKDYSHPDLGEGLYFIYLIVLLFFVVLFIKIYKKYTGLCQKEQVKVQYFLTGLIIFLFTNLTLNIFVSPFYGMIPWAYIANYSAIFFLSFTAYAIVKKELFDIKVALTSVFVSIIAILLFVDMFLFTDILWIRALKGFTLFVFLIAGYLLIKSVLREIKQREVIAKMAEGLEIKVQERTGELQKKVEQLEKTNRLIVGRELKMVDLKKSVKDLEKKLEDHGEGSEDSREK